MKIRYSAPAILISAATVSLISFYPGASFNGGAAAAEEPTFRDHIKNGEAAAAAIDWQTAVSEFEAAVRMDEKSSLANYDLGIAYCHVGRFEQALEAERKALEIDPRYVPAHIQVATILTRTQDLDGAEKSLRKALEVDPNSGIAQSNLDALLLLKNRKTAPEVAAQSQAPQSTADSSAAAGSEAKADPVTTVLSNPAILAPQMTPGAEKVIQSSLPQDSLESKTADLITEANAYFAQGAVSQARETLQRAVQFNPKSAVAHGNLGVALGTAGDFDGQIAEERKAVELEETNAEAHLNLAWALARKEGWTEAQREYKRALTLKPDLIEAELGKALADAKVGKSKLAIQDLNKAKETHAGAAWPYIGLGSIYSDQKKYDDALAALKEAVKLEPSNMEARQRLADLYLRRFEWNEAAEQYREALKLAPYDFSCYMGLGLACQKSGQNEEALKAFKTAAGIAPKSATVHASLSMVLEHMGRQHEAETEARLALRLDPRQAVASGVLKRVTRPQ
jgi:superkiller protein 3